jgi:hypothetical protein
MSEDAVRLGRFEVKGKLGYARIENGKYPYIAVPAEGLDETTEVLLDGKAARRYVHSGGWVIFCRNGFVQATLEQIVLDSLDRRGSVPLADIVKESLDDEPCLDPEVAINVGDWVQDDALQVWQVKRISDGLAYDSIGRSCPLEVLRRHPVLNLKSSADPISDARPQKDPIPLTAESPDLLEQQIQAEVRAQKIAEDPESRPAWDKLRTIADMMDLTDRKLGYTGTEVQMWLRLLAQELEQAAETPAPTPAQSAVTLYHHRRNEQRIWWVFDEDLDALWHLLEAWHGPVED